MRINVVSAMLDRAKRLWSSPGVRPYRIPVLGSAVVLVVAALMWGSSGTNEESVIVETPAATLWKPTALPALPSEVTVDYDQLYAQAAFYRTRKPYVAPPPETPPPDPAYRVVATMLKPDGRMALLVPHSGGDTVKVAVGADVEGWQVAAIAHQQVTLKRGGRSLLLLPGVLPTPAPTPAVAAVSMRRGQVLGNTPPRVRGSGMLSARGQSGSVAHESNRARTYRPPP